MHESDPFPPALTEGELDEIRWAIVKREREIMQAIEEEEFR